MAFSEDVPPVVQHTNRWHGSAAAGLTLTRGNSESFLATATAGAGRKWDLNEAMLGADAAYGTTKNRDTGNDTKTADAYHGFGQYNRLFTERLYGYGRADGLYDAVADIKYRVTLGPGAGYYFIKEKRIDFCGELGPGYIIEKLGNSEQKFATLRVGDKFHCQLSDRARLWQIAEWLPRVDKFKNYIINAEIGIESDLRADKKLSLRTYLQDTYNSVPAAGRRKNDVKLVAAVAFKF
ncbi:MAG TPA: DUF481 domain-containing protein [Verrucomicrobiae bacterium]|nr:DUF481 domain-containing protein [Verrucomicrobiae bacterium]